MNPFTVSTMMIKCSYIYKWGSMETEPLQRVIQ